MALKHKKREKSILLNILILLAVISIILSVISLSRPSASSVSEQQESALERTKREKKLRVAYGGFPPYTITDPNIEDPNKAVSGFCVDMINEIAQRQIPPWDVEWNKISWDSLRADMDSGKFDVLADGVYATVPRASEYLYSNPFSYFGVAVAVVRIDENRFRTFKDLDRKDITISLPEGWTSTEYARRVLKKANLNPFPIGDDINVTFNDVLSRRADVALQDVPTVLQFVREHSNEVKALWLDDPPLRVAAGFITRIGETDMIQFLNTCIRVLELDGTIERLDQKWNAYGEYIKNNYKPGQGLKH